MRRMWSRLRAVLWSLALLLSAVGCGPPPKDPAVQAYEQFVRAIRGRQGVLVWRMLSPSSQRALALRLGVKSDADPNEIDRLLGLRPGWQFELDLPQQARLDPAKQDADRRVVVGPLGGRTLQIPVVRVDGAWRVDLFAATPAPDAGAGD